MKLRQLFEEVHNVIIQEAIDYDQMFEKPFRLMKDLVGRVDDLDHVQTLNNLMDVRDGFIRRIKNDFNRSDIKLYSTRLLKVLVLRLFMTGVVSRIDNETLNYVDQQLQRIGQEYNKQRNFFERSLESEKATRSSYDLNTFLNNLDHFLSLPIPAIQSFRFENQEPEDILEYFSSLEEEWKEQGGDQLVPYQDEQVIMDFNDGFAWYDLDTASCGLEGRSMKHCGNSPMEGDTNHTIYSLREDKGNGMLRPVATFIINKQTRMVGEMKGRANEKPQPKYHRYIVPLLMSDEVEGVVGGGYLPENNFSIKDVSGWEDLVQQKPTLLTLGEYVEEFGVDEYVSSKINVGGEFRVAGDDVRNQGLLSNYYDVPSIDMDSILDEVGEISTDDVLQVLTYEQETEIEEIFNDDEDEDQEWKSAEEILRDSEDQGTPIFDELMMTIRDEYVESIEEDFERKVKSHLENPAEVVIDGESDDRLFELYSEEIPSFIWTVEEDGEGDWIFGVSFSIRDLIEHLSSREEIQDYDLELNMQEIRYYSFEYIPNLAINNPREFQKTIQTVIDQFK